MSYSITKKSAIVEIFTNASVNPSEKLIGVAKEDHQDALAQIMELSANPNPNNRYELQQIITYVVQNVLDIRLNYLPHVAEVKNTAFNERPNFKIKTEKIQAFWQAMGSTTQKTKIGYKYDNLKLEELSAYPVAEWAEIAAGRYDFAELIRDVTNEFEQKIGQKVQSTLFTAFNGLPSPNYANGNGIVATAFDPLLVAMQRMGGRATIVGDYEALIKLPALTAISGRTSNEIINEANRSGVIGTYKGAPVVVLDNPYTGLYGFAPTLDKGYIYIVPSGDDSNKSLKVQFAGDITFMDGQNIKDSSYDMRYDKKVAAGVIANTRHALGVYEDTSLS